MYKNNQIFGNNKSNIQSKFRNLFYFSKYLFVEHRLIFEASNNNSAETQTPQSTIESVLASSEWVSKRLSFVPDLKWSDIERYKSLNETQKNNIREFVRINNKREYDNSRTFNQSTIDIVWRDRNLIERLWLNDTQKNEWTSYYDSLPSWIDNLWPLRFQLFIIKDRLAWRSEIQRERLLQLQSQETHDTTPMIFKPFTWLNTQLQSDNAWKVYADRNAMFNVLEEWVKQFVRNENHNRLYPQNIVHDENEYWFTERMVQNLQWLIINNSGIESHLRTMLWVMIKIQRIEKSHNLNKLSEDTIKATTLAIQNRQLQQTNYQWLNVQWWNLIVSDNITLTPKDAEKMDNIRYLADEHDLLPANSSNIFNDLDENKFNSQYLNNAVLRQRAKDLHSKRALWEIKDQLKEDAKSLRSSNYQLNFDNLSSEQKLLWLWVLVLWIFKDKTWKLLKFLWIWTLWYLWSEAFWKNPVDFINWMINKAKSSEWKNSIYSWLIDIAKDPKEQIAVWIMWKVRPSVIMDYLNKNWWSSDWWYDSVLKSLSEWKWWDDILGFITDSYGSEWKDIRASLRTHWLELEHYARALYTVLSWLWSQDWGNTPDPVKWIAQIQKEAWYDYSKSDSDKYKLADWTQLEKKDFWSNKRLWEIMFTKFAESWLSISWIALWTVEWVKTLWEKAKLLWAGVYDKCADYLKAQWYFVVRWENNSIDWVYMPGTWLLSLLWSSNWMMVSVTLDWLNEAKKIEKTKQIISIMNQITWAALPDNKKIDISSEAGKIQQIWNKIYNPIAPNTVQQQQTKLDQALQAWQNQKTNLDGILSAL